MFGVHIPSWFRFWFNDLIWKIPTTEKHLYLTFDDSPFIETTNFILENLNKYNAEATFFCLGKNAENYPELFRKISKKHTIGNHSYSHLNGWKTDNKVYFEDIRKAQEIIQSEIFRPPYGKIKLSQIKELKKTYKIIMWDVMSRDFSIETSPKKCLNNVLKYAQSGSIIVLHDSKKAKKNMQYILPEILKIYTDKGYVFKKL